jgi:hypothetical protein
VDVNRALRYLELVNVVDPLETTARQCRQIARQWAARLCEDDQLTMVRAFHRAETLAHHALSNAIEQLPHEYRDELLEQLDDETRHVNVFANWQDEEPLPIRAPKNKSRAQHVWFTLLLINEITGFCQFHMLYGLVGDPVKAAAVAGIAADETRHIQRLLRWLGPFANTPSKSEVFRIVAAFRAKLTGRMSQFLPREELAGLRTEMALSIDELLGQLTTPFLVTERSSPG